MATKIKKMQDGGERTVREKTRTRPTLSGGTKKISKTIEKGGNKPKRTHKFVSVTDKNGYIIKDKVSVREDGKKIQGYTKKINPRKEFPEDFDAKGNPKPESYKTGGMVNPNAKLQAAKSAGSKGVKSGVNPKATAAKKATGKSSGGVDTPPKTAVPKAKYGMSITKMKRK
jgi:hypothetical protein